MEKYFILKISKVLKGIYMKRYILTLIIKESLGSSFIQNGKEEEIYQKIEQKIYIAYKYKK